MKTNAEPKIFPRNENKSIMEFCKYLFVSATSNFLQTLQNKCKPNKKVKLNDNRTKWRQYSL